MNQHDKMLRDALQALLDVQNGPPLFKTKDEWESAMEAGYEALAHVNETPKNEHDSDDVLNKSGNVNMMRETLREIQAAAEDCAKCDYPWPHKQNYRDFAKHAKQALATKPDQTQCPIGEGDAVKQASYVCKKCGADFADAQCNRENIESWHRKPLVRLTDEGIDLVADNHKISILKIAKSESPKTIRDGVLELAHAIMDAMEEKNK